MNRLRHLVATSTALATFALGAAACGPSGGAPSLDGLTDQTAFVGSELALTLRASDPDLDELRFTYDSDIDGVSARAGIRPYGDGSAVFHFTPIAADVGQHAFDFSVTDGSYTTTETITIEVKSSIGANSAPIFREPLGTGTTLDLATRTCIDVHAVVEDSDTPEVAIDQEEPVIEGATLDQDTGLTATWHWCPTAGQVDAQDRYALQLSADDMDNPKTTKNFLIVLKKTPKPDCPGDPPIVAHTPMDESTLVGLTVTADIGDTEGLKNEPLFYYAASPPASPPDLGAMTQLTMILLDGDMRQGTWGADVPNPVAGGMAGATATLYYVIVAADNDDVTGDCDHTTQAPTSGVYQMTVTNPGGSGGLGLCQECTADAQCGGPADNCVRMGTEGKYYCFKACTMDSDCGDPAYYCSITALTSKDGVMARQCIPSDYSCVEPMPMTCTDDSYEENDTRTQAGSKPVLAPGTYSAMKSCPASATADDEDWFKITVAADAQVAVSIAGGTASDLDLALTQDSGVVIVKSESASSSEMVSTCLLPGTYYLHVHAYGDPAENPYTLTYTRTAMSCGGMVCTDDPDEPDDSYSSARRIDDALPHMKANNQICAMDDDWYRVNLFAGETVYATIAFTQTTAAEDLDLHLYRGTTDLTPCSESAPGTCSAANGQGSNSNENMSYTVSTAGYYYVVVHGWNGAQNGYNICIGLASTACPPLP